jgi:hypothetical protein
VLECEYLRLVEQQCIGMGEQVAGGTRPPSIGERPHAARLEQAAVHFKIPADLLRHHVEIDVPVHQKYAAGFQHANDVTQRVQVRHWVLRVER